MPYITPPSEPILREVIEQEQLNNFRGIIQLLGWDVVPFRFLGHSLTAFSFATQFNLQWLHTFYEVYATTVEQKQMLKAGYQPRS